MPNNLNVYCGRTRVCTRKRRHHVNTSTTRLPRMLPTRSFWSPMRVANENVSDCFPSSKRGSTRRLGHHRHCRAQSVSLSPPISCGVGILRLAKGIYAPSIHASANLHEHGNHLNWAAVEAGCRAEHTSRKLLACLYLAALRREEAVFWSNFDISSKA